MSEITTTPQPDPFGRMVAAHGGLNVGAVAIEQERAIAEAQGQLILAKRFPRSMAQARADFMEACKSPEFAAKAFYAVPNRGSGPSIRFAEEAARCYGNFQYGHRELSRSEGKSEVEVFAWDMEKNNHSRRQITVLHILDTKNGPKKLTDQTDIDNRVANVASKQMRGRILALLPKELVEAGQAMCKLTISGDNDKPIAARVAEMTQAFTKFGVNAKQLADYIGHSLDNVTTDELADMIGVYNAIKEGARASEYFAVADKADETGLKLAAALPPAAPAQPSAAAPAAAPAAQAPAPAAPAAQRRVAVKTATPAPAPAPATPPPPPPPAPAAPPAAGPGDDGPAGDDPPFGDDDQGGPPPGSMF
jgi:hypothetical protein